jgi:alpha-1,3-rhamnosyl/mannosyltransferase
LIELYEIPAERIVVTPNGVDTVFSPRDEASVAGDGYLLYVGAIQSRKDPLAAMDAADAVGLPLVVVGPEKEPELAAELRRRGADLRGYLASEELADVYRYASALVFPSRYEGFGLPLVEAMASGIPVVAADEPALREVAGDAALFAPRDELGAAVTRALAERDRLRAAGLERVKLYSWAETARLTLEVYREAIE